MTATKAVALWHLAGIIVLVFAVPLNRGRPQGLNLHKIDPNLTRVAGRIPDASEAGTIYAYRSSDFAQEY